MTKPKRPNRVPLYQTHTHISPFKSHPLPAKFAHEELPADIEGEDRQRLTESHVYQRIPPSGKKKYPSKRCRVCLARSGYARSGQRKHPKETSYHCVQCPSKPPLCTYPCFWLYHNKVKYADLITEEETQAMSRSMFTYPLPFPDVPRGPTMVSGARFSSFAGVSGGQGSGYSGGQNLGEYSGFGMSSSSGFAQDEGRSGLHVPAQDGGGSALHVPAQEGGGSGLHVPAQDGGGSGLYVPAQEGESGLDFFVNLAGVETGIGGEGSAVKFEPAQPVYGETVYPDRH